MNTTANTLPDELFDNNAEQENYPAEGNETQTGAATDLDDIQTDETDEDDSSITGTDD